ncbi:MAG TPA: Trk system potassium transporter TrkA [Bacillota bacterium]
MNVVIVGAGKLGFELTKILSQENHNIIVVDKDPDSVGPIADNFDVMTVVGNGASVKILKEIQVNLADVLLAVTENDELNIIACMLAKQLGAKTTIARVRNPEYSPSLPTVSSLNHFGIDLFINSEYMTSQELLRLIEVPYAVDIDYLADGQLSLNSIKIDESLGIAGKKISALNFEKFTVVAISRNEKIIIPSGETELLLNDKIFVLGRSSGFHNLFSLNRFKKNQFKRIVIAGGGLTTQYLVQLLRMKKNRPQIEIIEPSREQCLVLSKELDNCRIICADATRMEIYEEENLGPEDLFIALTGSDNTNLVASMLAKKRNVVEIICEISREDYTSLAETIGITSTVTPRLLTVNTVLNLVRKKSVISINLLSNGDAALLELEAGVNAPITKAPLKSLALPAGVVIGALLRDGNVVVPRGDTLIHTGDHAVVFTQRSVTNETEKMFSGSQF